MHKNLRPFLKWAGGKTQLLPVLLEEMPLQNNDLKVYVEPFVGAGAVFFELIKEDKFEKYIINDINTKLINLYKTIRDDVTILIKELSNLKNQYINLDEMNDKEEMFYRIREEFNDDKISKTTQAAYFIFLNKTCFNGLYRENSKGVYNVPFGKHKNISIFQKEQLTKISEFLNLKGRNGNQRVEIYNFSFEDLKEFIDNNSFVYFDPPYRPITTGGFNSYSKSNFNDKEQQKLAQFYRELDKKGIYLMLSNSDPKNLDINDKFFDELYKDFNINRIKANRMINSKGTGRGAISELLITNYKKTSVN